MKKFYAVLIMLLISLALLSATALGATVTTAGSGNWSSTAVGAPWPGGILPQPTDDVIIADGNTVTIDQGVTVNNLTVGQGTSGTLTFDGVAARVVVVTGDVTVAAGGSFTSQAAGAFTNTMSIGGNISNSGTLDLSHNSSTTICNVTFTKAGDQTISGTTPTLTRFRGVTLNKTALANRVVASIDVSMAGSALFVFTNGTWEQTAGTLSETSGSQTIASTGALKLSGSGSFNMVIAGSLTVTGSLTVNTSGTFMLGSGNNAVTVGSATSLANFTAGTITIFGRLTLTAGTTTINGATIMIDPQSTNNLGATSNSFEISGTANVTFSSGSVTLVDPNAAITTGNDLKIGNTVGTLDLTGSTIIFGDGSSSSTSSTTGGFQISNNTASPVVLGNVIVQTGTTVGRNKVVLGTGATVGGTLTLTSGTITTTTANLLMLASTASVIGGSATSFVNGPMSHTWTTATATKTYPLGKAATYRPLIVALTTPASPVLRAEVFNANAGGTSALNAISTVRYYQTSLVAGTAVSGGTVQITYGADDGVSDFSQLVVAQCTTVNGTYLSLGGAAGDATTITSATAYNPGAGDFLLMGSSGTNVLPVELVSFTALANKNNVDLAWSTATEVNNYGFDVERKSATSDWAKITFVQGNETSNAVHNYSYTDNAGLGKYSYRLKQIDRDGKFQYSAAVEATVGVVPNAMVLGQNYPNPFNPETSIEFAVPATGHTTLKVYNMLGQEIATLVNGNIEAGVLNHVSFKGSNFPSGMYFYTLRSGNFVDAKKMLMIK